MKGAATSLPSIGSANESVVHEGGLIFSCSGRHAGIKYPADRQSTFTSRQRRLLALMAYGNFWVAACVSLQAPFFPNEAEKKGASSTIYGLVFGVYELMIIMFSPVFGRFVSSANFLVQAGLAVCGLSTVLFG